MQGGDGDRDKILHWPLSWWCALPVTPSHSQYHAGREGVHAPADCMKLD